MTQVRLAVYSVDPPALDPFFAFDPESFVAISMIADSLVFFDEQGRAQPGLAIEWELTSPVTMELELRRGVTFHDGSPFDAESVVATFEAHLDPKDPSVNGRGLLAPIKSCTKVNDFRVCIETHFPDALLLRRFFFSQIYPAHILRSGGKEAIHRHPIGTGAYSLVRWERGREIVLARNKNHWAGRATVDHLVLPIRKQKEWVDGLVHNEIDIALNIDAHDAARLAGTEVAVNHAPAALSQWFLLANKGPLADVRVRRALNHGVHRRLLAEVSEHGHARPQASVTTQEAEGFHPGIKPYRYAPELARRLLSEAGHEQLTLRGLVSETSIALYLAVKEFLAKIGVTLEAEIVPRGDWLKRIVVDRAGGVAFDGDFALTNVDNPVLHALFHEYIFFFSQGPFSLTNSPEYDKVFLKAATTLDPTEAPQAIRAVEEHVHSEALCLFTVQQDVFAAHRPGFHIPLSPSGHFNNNAFWDMTAPTVAVSKTPKPAKPEVSADLSALVDATSHTGLFYMRPGTTMEDPTLQQLWRNIGISQERWLVQLVPMLRELVAQVDARSNLVNVLGSTKRVVIVGYDLDGRQMFANAGFNELVGTDERPLPELFDADGSGITWAAMRGEVDASGSWLGPVNVHAAAGRRHLYLTVTQAQDEQGASIGYTFVLSDFSGEEERIRSGAIRTILDHVPFGLLRIDASLCVLEGTSTACDRLLTRGGGAIAGRPLAELLGLQERERSHFESVCGQVFDDVLPEEVCLGQLPERIRSGERVLSLSGSVVREPSGAIASVLFTIADVTSLDDAERETARIRGVLQVLRFRTRFADFVMPFVATLDSLIRRDAADEVVRRELHTAKGVFAQFGIVDVAHLIHEVEDHTRIAIEDLAAVRDAVVGVLARNEELWGIRLDGPQHSRIEIDEAETERLEQQVGQARTLDEARALVRAFRQQAQEHPAHVMAGPLAILVEQLGQRFGKQVGFVLEGGDVRVPRALGRLFSSLTHLVRNAVDHGIEAPDRREGKPAAATVAVAVMSNDDGFVVTVRDDGRGIDVDRVVELAVAAGAVRTEEAAAMTESERLALVLCDGLSTADEVTDVSGRGIGTSAVADVVKDLGGTVEVESRPGVGTTFRIRVPTRRAAELESRTSA